MPQNYGSIKNKVGVSEEYNTRIKKSEVNVFYAGSQSKAQVDPYGGRAGVEAGVISKEEIYFNGDSFINKAFAIGVEGGATTSHVGGEIKASLAESTKTFGNVSWTLGLNANTGASIGLDRTGAKVLGTGGYIGREGLELSLFGSGFKIRF